jgi:tetratricopeptide (TPR) repeat protein
MKRLYALFGGATVALLAASYAMAMDSTMRQSDLGAGPIVAHVTSCLIANRSHRGAPCPEPQVSQAPDNAERVVNRVERAWFFIDMQDFDKARAETELALAIDPNDLKARHLSARLALTVGDIARAEADLATARKQAPDDPDVRATCAMLLQSRPADLESLREFEAVILKHPHHRFAREQRAQLLMRLGQYAAALEDFNFIVDDNPPNTNSLVRRSEAFLALGKPQSAVADLSTAIKMEPSRFDLLAARADAYVRADLGELALRDYDAVLAMTGSTPLYVMFDNERAKLLAKRANTYVRLRRFDDAAGDMVTAISLGGVPAILRAQVLLRRHGFSDVPLDGHDSPALRQALTACFGLNACFQGIMRAI